ncbi:MAG: MFS transporter [Legionellales bacterium]
MLSHSAVDLRTFVPRGGLVAWVVCLSAGLFFLYEFFQLNIFDVINQPLRDDFHMDAAQLSWMSSSYLWADILFLLPAGVILDRFSTRNVILTALLVCVIGTVGFAVTSSFAVASFCHFLSGIGNAFSFLACVVLVSRWFPPRRQALVIGSIVTMAFIGGMMAHTPFACLYDLFGWRRALLIDGAVGAFIFLLIYWVVKDQPEDSPARIKTNQGHVLSDLVKALYNPQNWLAGLYTSFLNLPVMVLCALWGASYLQTVHHLSDMAASNMVSLIFMGSIVGCPLVGWLSDTQGARKPIMIIGAVATLLTLIPLFLDVPLTQWSLSVIFIALGFFTSTQVIAYPLIAESNAAENTGAAIGIASVIVMGGGGVGQVLFGWLMAKNEGIHTVAYSIADFQFAMWMFPIAAVAALIMVLLIHETFCKRETL